MRTFQLLLEKRLIICFFLFFVLLIQGCASDDAMNTDAPDIEATITAAIAKSLPAPVATGNSTLESEIKFRVQATIAAQSVSPVSPKTDSIYSIVPTPRPMIQSSPTAEPIIVPTVAPTPILVPPPTPTPTPSALELVSTLVESVRPSVVAIKGLARSGYGVVIEASSFDKSAIILTNYNIVEGSESVIVTIGNSNLTGQVLGADPNRNLSLIYVCCGDFLAISLGDSKSLNRGDKVISVKNDKSEDDQLGFVESVVSEIVFDEVRDSWIIRMDSSIDGLSSGVPIISPNGKLIAINAVRSDYDHAEKDVSGTSFGVAEETVSDAIQSLKRGVYTAVPLHPLGKFSHGSYYNWAYNLYYAGEYDLALKELHTAMLLDRDHLESYLYRGMIYEKQGNIGMAIGDYDVAASLNTRLVSAYALRAGFYFNKMQDYLKSLKNYELILGIKPLDMRALIGRGDSYYMIGQVNQAIKDYSRVIELYADSAVVGYQKRSLAYDQIGESEKAQNDRATACTMSITYCQLTEY